MLSFLCKRSGKTVLKASPRVKGAKIAPFQLLGIQNIFSKSFSSHSQEQQYIPFATDVAREHASIKFWVSKNTNLKEVNVNIRVF